MRGGMNSPVWFACIELDGHRCPFPFAIELQNEDSDIPAWLSEEIKATARLLARSLGARMGCYATAQTPEIAVEFTSTFEEADLLIATEFPDGEAEPNHDVHVDDFKEEYWFPQDWPGTTVLSIYMPEYY